MVSAAGKISLTSDVTCLPAHLSHRYKLCQLLPRLRSSLRLPADKQLLQKLDFCVQKLLCREKDKDVVAIIRKVTTPVELLSEDPAGVTTLIHDELTVAIMFSRQFWNWTNWTSQSR